MLRKGAQFGHAIIFEQPPKVLKPGENFAGCSIFLSVRAVPEISIYMKKTGYPFLSNAIVGAALGFQYRHGGQELLFAIISYDRDNYIRRWLFGFSTPAVKMSDPAFL